MQPPEILTPQNCFNGYVPEFEVWFIVCID